MLRRFSWFNLASLIFSVTSIVLLSPFLWGWGVFWFTLSLFSLLFSLSLPLFPEEFTGKGKRALYFLSAFSLEVLCCSLSFAFPFPIWVPILFGCLFFILSALLFRRYLQLFCKALRPKARK
ncbi:MAG: hypothetical protein IIY27_00490 [Aeriscardovia sp.]|nr:hypothetical protein [Aeriscardovia sp.]